MALWTRGLEKGATIRRLATVHYTIVETLGDVHSQMNGFVDNGGKIAEGVSNALLEQRLPMRGPDGEFTCILKLNHYSSRSLSLR